MSAPVRTPPFVAGLRSRPGVVRLGAPGEALLSLRVQVPEVWDVVRFELPPTTPVREVKARALALLQPGDVPLESYVCKLAGFEVLDETLSVAEAGVRDGSTLLLTSRHRQPVR